MRLLSLVLSLVTIAASGAIGSLRISEFLAVNGSGLVDKDGDRSDWIELYNPDADSVDLAGWYLTDDPDTLTKWRFPEGRVSSGGYTLVHASGKDFESLFSAEIHANFSLSGDGEYLALIEPDGLTVAHEYAATYPDQRKDVSYGLVKDSETLGYFLVPTPGEPNGVPSDGLVAGVNFSVKRGYYDEAFVLELSTDTPDALIRYTENGGRPSLFNGKTYTGPITIDGTTTIRAQAEKRGWIASKLKTHTYLFVDDVVQQETMSPKVTEDAVYGPQMREALRKYPAISLVTPNTDISKTVEDPTSVEMIFPDGSDGFQIDAGVKRVGGHSLNAYPKNNMRLYFRSEYGTEKLRFPLFKDHRYTDVAADSFDQLNLRGGSHDSLFYLGASSPPQAPSNGQYLRNRWINDMQFLMGHESLRGRWVHLYINGNYWGHYQIMERNTQDYFASYLGGKKSDHVAINKGQGIGGSDMRAWQAMRDSVDDYAEFQRRVDVENYVDYMLLNYYGGNDWDWNPEQNWAAGGPAAPDAGGMKFLAWDSDIIFRRLNDNNLAKGGPHSMFPSLLKHEEFAILVADRIQKHFYNDGLLTPAKVAGVYNARAEEIRLSIIPETARWENGRWTRDNQWQAELDRLNGDFFPNRTKEVLKQFQSKGWTGATAAPTMSRFGGYVERGFELRLQKSLFALGAIVYTIDGSDPRLVGGEQSPAAVAYGGPISLTDSVTVKARIVNGAGWSALTEARFVVDQVPASAEALTISKIDYQPAMPSAEEIAAGYGNRKDFEFIELLNLGTQTIDLYGLRFNEGINFDFASAEIASLEGGGRLLVVSSVAAFALRYGEALPVAGSFSGNLANDGELLRLVNREGDVIQSLTYEDADPWPSDADGAGRFLVLDQMVKAHPDNPSQWRASKDGDRPGEGVGEVPDLRSYEDWAMEAFPTEVDTARVNDFDRDGFANVLEFALGTDPTARSSVPHYSVSSESDGRVRFTTLQRSLISGLVVKVQVSSDLETWQTVDAGSVSVVSESAGEGSMMTRVVYRLARDAVEDRSFVRLSVE